MVVISTNPIDFFAVFLSSKCAAAASAFDFSAELTLLQRAIAIWFREPLFIARFCINLRNFDEFFSFG